jgi:hypothetical protein
MGWNYKELLVKSSLEQGVFRGFKNLLTEEIYGKR